MTVLLVLFTLIVFLVTDYFVQKSRSSGARAKGEARSHRQFLLPSLHFPDDASLALNHTWARHDRDGTTTLGLDEFLGRLVGTVESIALPEIGTRVTPATVGIALRQGNKSLELSTPLAGRVVTVNPDILKNPSIVRSDPYGKGWLMTVKPEAEDNTLFKKFMVEKPGEWLAQQTERAKEFFRAYLAQGQPALMQDGGIPTQGLLQECDAEVWAAFKESFVALDDPQIH